MRALAEFTMRGRLQAGLVAVFGCLVPFISPAVVSLVTLRKGLTEGIMIFLWALLPTLLAGYGSGFATLMIALSATVLLVSLIAAETLKLAVSWSNALFVIVAGCALAVLTINQLMPAVMVALDEYIAGMFKEIAARVEQPVENRFIPGRGFILGMMGYMLAINVFLSLLLGRWWQSQLYNPGGLRAEFHQLRLQLVPAAVLIAGVVFCYISAPDYSGWAGLLGLPLLLSAVSLVHFSVATLGMGAHWLVMFYIGLILFGPLSVILVGIGFLDSVMDIRSRISPKTGEQG